jgi:[ribosomal protein S5]-alanine N-acetyltransferase
VTGAVETARLVGEPIGLDHHDALLALVGDPRVGVTLGGVLTPEQAAESLAGKVAHWREHGFGYWVWRERATGEVIARGGLGHVAVGGRDEVEVGWAVLPERWRQGLATELGAAAARVGFEQLGFDELVAFTLPANQASRRVMEKLGMSYEREVMHAGILHVLYRARRAP